MGQVEASNPITECLNESPSKKEGKYRTSTEVRGVCCCASMKALPRRKGNLRWLVRACSANLTLNESPSEQEGKFRRGGRRPPNP